MLTACGADHLVAALAVGLPAAMGLAFWWGAIVALQHFTWRELPEGDDPR